MAAEVPGKSSGWRVYVAAGLVVVVFALVCLEALAWMTFAARSVLREAVSEILSLELQLDPYEIKDDVVPGHWRLRPGYGATTDELIAAKDDAGKWLGSEAIRSTQDAELKTLTINDDGFKGAPLDPTHRCPRILAIGDSVTFGLGATSYPHFMQRAFDAAGLCVEVVNAGVEGYGPRNVIYELDRDKALKPEYVTVYIGWNAIFSSDLRAGAAGFTWLKTPWLLTRAKYVLSSIIQGPTAVSTKLYNKALNPDIDSPEIKQIQSRPLDFEDDLSQLVSELRAMDTEVYLVSLFGLFQVDQMPSEEAMRIGHLPAWTDNPYVLAVLADLTNDSMRRLSEQDHVHYVNMQSWGRETLRPPEKFFFDSVHFNLEGLQRVGGFLAKMLMPSVVNRQHMPCCQKR